MLINLQKRYRLSRTSLTMFVRNLKRRLRLGKAEFNVCFVDDGAMRRLNSTYRGKDKPTDVLSFAWNEAAGRSGRGRRARSLQPAWGVPGNFLGDVAISVETARRNASAEGHSTLNEIRWLILHGTLHLLGYDHERDGGEMMARELQLREQLGIAYGRAGGENDQRQSAASKGRDRQRPRF